MNFRKDDYLWIILLVGLIVGCGKIENPPPAGGGTVLPAEMAKLDDVFLTELPIVATGNKTFTQEPNAVSTVFIPAGKFMMGSLPETGFEICEASRPGCKPEDFEDESPVHEVYLGAYWIDQYEVTNANFRRCVDDGACEPPVILEFFGNPIFDSHPVVFVSWFQGEAYCQWAGGLLPTEAQWEKAARGKDQRNFPWGNEMDCGFANLKGCTQGLTMNVGSFPSGASEFGVMDLAGNATEWVADWYDPEYYTGSLEGNPSGPYFGELKVARGGSWKNPFVGVRSTNRVANFPEVYSSGVGFRCAYMDQP